jgi:hypothetical protein
LEILQNGRFEDRVTLWLSLCDETDNGANTIPAAENNTNISETSVNASARLLPNKSKLITRHKVSNVVRASYP